MKTRSLAIFLAGAVAATTCWILAALYLQNAVVSDLSRPDQEAGSSVRTYADLGQARASGLFVRFRLPDVVPEDARDISERRRPGTRDAWACFTTFSGRESIRNRLEQLGARHVPIPMDTPRHGFPPSEVFPKGTEAYELKGSGGGASVVAGLLPDPKAICFFTGGTP